MEREQREWRFTIPTLPPSVNSLHNVIYSQRRVELKPEIRQWRSDAKVYIPRLELQADSLLDVVLIFHYRQRCANGSLRRFDTHNVVKPLLDLIAEKAGFDDARIKSGSWASIDSPREQVEVCLREV